MLPKIALSFKKLVYINLQLYMDYIYNGASEIKNIDG